jgi:hypothetical protein
MSGQAAAIDRARAFAYGRLANDPYAKLLRKWMTLWRFSKLLHARASQLGEERIAVAEHRRPDRQQTPANAELAEEPRDADVDTYWKDKRWLAARIEENRDELWQAVLNAIMDGNAEWFLKMGNALDIEKTGLDAYPLHAAILELLQPGWHRQDIIWPPDPPYGGELLDTTPRFTIGDVCKQLESRCMKPEGQSDEDWKSTVRRACKEVGLRILKSKPGPQPKKS